MVEIVNEPIVVVEVVPVVVTTIFLNANAIASGIAVWEEVVGLLLWAPPSIV